MQTQNIEQLVKDFFKESGLHAGEVAFTYDDETKTIWCGISTPDSRLLTGKNGETLAAINHLVRKMVEKSMGIQEGGQAAWTVIVDINGYQKKRVDSVKAIAHMMAERARFFKSSIEVDPMSPFERRIVHEFISNMPDLKTESAGEGPRRHVVIKYVGGEKTI
jgi:spoIIIJ-associated protein